MKRTILLLPLAALASFGQAIDRPSAPVRTPQQMVIDSRIARLPAEQRITLYEAQLKENPRDLRLQVNLGQAYLHRMRETTDYSYAERAQKMADRARKTDPNFYDAHKLQVEIHLFRHEFSKVIELSRTLAARNPKDAVNWATLGDAYMETGQYDPAADAYQKMVNLQADLMSYNRIAWWRWVTGDAEGAIEMMTKAIRAGRPGHENTAWCLVELGNLYLKTGKLQQAEQAYLAAIQTFPKMHSAYAGLGQAYAAQDKLQPAVEALKKAQAMAPMVEYAGWLADLYTAQGNTQEARKQLDLVDLQAKMEAASGQKANRVVALIYANHKHKLPEALEIAKADLAVRQDVFTWDAYAWVLYQQGKLEDAATASRQALRAGTKDPLLLYHAGMIAKAHGDPEKAREWIGAALKLNPKFDSLQAPLAEQALAGSL